MSEEEKKDLPAEIQARLEKLNIGDVDWARGLSPEEILYLLNRCPFLQIVSTGNAEPLPEPKFITAKSGWTIHHYGDAMSSSPGELLFKSSDFRKLFETEDETIANPGKGTLVKQAYDTAAEMVKLAQEFHWQGIKIVDGHPLMMWAAWMQATDDAFSLEGYDPEEKDIEKRERVKRSDVEDQLQIDINKLSRK